MQAVSIHGEGDLSLAIQYSTSKPDRHTHAYYFNEFFDDESIKHALFFTKINEMTAYTNYYNTN